MTTAEAHLPVNASVIVEGPSKGALSVRLTGDWTLATLGDNTVDPQDSITAEGDVKKLVLDIGDVGEWDSTLVTFAVNLERYCAERQITFDGGKLPSGITRLLELTKAGRRAEVAPHVEPEKSVLADAGRETLKALKATGDMLEFFGESCQALMRWMRGTSRMRSADMFLVIEQTGPQALPIVTLICFLIGVILAFVGAIQLEKFAAGIFVANLVGIGMVRELGPVMAGIVMAGRTGAAFAAQLGTMTVNEEIAALRTVGVPPMDFLVLPRMLALILMMPLLAIYANVVGMLGGMLIANAMLGISTVEYFNQTASAVSLVDWIGGLIKASLFGIIVAVAGCLRGIQCGRSASDVGIAATSAVVTGIVFIILVDAILTVFYTMLGI